MEGAISSSLLENIDPNRQVSEDFDLGMNEFVHVGTVENPAVSGTHDYGCEYEPRPKKSKLAAPAENTRYYRATTEELQKLSKPYVPKNTDTNTKWAYNNFQSWVEQRNRSEAGEKCPADILEKAEPQQLDKWLSLYVVENRKVNGEPYPSRTIYSLLTGLLRYMRSKNDAAPNFLEKKNPSFKQLHSTMDSVFRSLREQGIGAQKKSADPFSKDEEMQLWTLGVMGTDTPLALFRAVFFYNGKNFCLRGGEEHRSLKLSQLKRTEEGYIYTENASKNRAGGLTQLRLENKMVPVMARPEAGRYCHCELLDLYISKLPSKIKEMDILYARPLNQRPDDESLPWFAPVPVGRNKLSKVISDMCSEAKIDGHKTNHSLRATGATQLYNAGVPEKITQQRTGHRSLDSLRVYEHTSVQQHRAVTNILLPTTRPQVCFEEEVRRMNTSMSQNMSPATLLNNTIQPIMNFSGCTVNINLSSPPSLSSTPSKLPQEHELPSLDDVMAFIKDVEY